MLSSGIKLQFLHWLRQFLVFISGEQTVITEVEQLQNTLLNWLFSLPPNIFMLWKQFTQEVILSNALHVPAEYVLGFLGALLLIYWIKRMSR
jgi:hypothetical protein